MKKTIALFAVLLLLLPVFLPAPVAAAAGVFELTEGNPAGESIDVRFSVSNELSSGQDDAEIRSLKRQDLDNGCVRFTMDYTLPDGLSVFLFNPPDGNVIRRGGTEPVSGSGTLQFDLSPEELSSVEEIAMSFGTDDSNRLFVFFRLSDEPAREAATGGPDRQIELTDGQPVGDPYEIVFDTSDELGEVSGEAAIRSFSCQLLDNDCYRLTMDYSMPEGLSVFIFNPPDGDIIRMAGTEPTPSGNGSLQFDISAADLLCARELAVSFNKPGTNQSYFTFLRIDNNAFLQSRDFFNLTRGKPVGEEQPVSFYISNELAEDRDIPVIHSITYQELDNEHVRLRVDYTMPEGLDVMIFDAPDYRIRMGSENKTGSGRNTLLADIKRSDLKMIRFELMIVFGYEGKDTNYFVYLNRFIK